MSARIVIEITQRPVTDGETGARIVATATGEAATVTERDATLRLLQAVKAEGLAIAKDMNATETKVFERENDGLGHR